MWFHHVARVEGCSKNRQKSSTPSARTLVDCPVPITGLWQSTTSCARGISPQWDPVGIFHTPQCAWGAGGSVPGVQAGVCMLPFELWARKFKCSFPPLAGCRKEGAGLPGGRSPAGAWQRRGRRSRPGTRPPPGRAPGRCFPPPAAMPAPLATCPAAGAAELPLLEAEPAGSVSCRS